jgi:hypothetical protein
MVNTSISVASYIIKYILPFTIATYCHYFQLLFTRPDRDIIKTDSVIGRTKKNSFKSMKKILILHNPTLKYIRRKP